ncbi:MAG TPA: hypothetical protein ENJ35_04350 [Gammaproteobacteria bacterium]|nr:hypothetical protein [Gammaproteobacteria bacterium]
MDHHIETLNYLKDQRTRGSILAPVLFLDDTEITLPTRWVVCPVCNGEGKHVNPAIDCGGLTSEDFRDDPDFAENYREGVYDVRCNCCNGRTTVQEVDFDKLTQEQEKAYLIQLQEEDDDRACMLAEMAMGA